LPKAYTRLGDDGFSYSPTFNRRLPKDHEIFEVLGTLDELNSYIGLIVSKLRSISKIQDMINELIWIQRVLFKVGNSIVSRKRAISEDDLRKLEEIIDERSNVINSIKGFVLPGGHEIASLLHIARTVCRRCERRIVKLMRQYEDVIDPLVVKYINRLSSYLFISALYVNKCLNIGELWVESAQNTRNK